MCCVFKNRTCVDDFFMKQMRCIFAYENVFYSSAGIRYKVLHFWLKLNKKSHFRSTPNFGHFFGL